MDGATDNSSLPESENVPPRRPREERRSGTHGTNADKAYGHNSGKSLLGNPNSVESLKATPTLGELIGDQEVQSSMKVQFQTHIEQPRKSRIKLDIQSSKSSAKSSIQLTCSWNYDLARRCRATDKTASTSRHSISPIPLPPNTRAELARRGLEKPTYSASSCPGPISTSWKSRTLQVSKKRVGW